ncbi:hypothetical protein CHS0354_041046 [Potamilus streckersoni]|uniref:ALMS motif domain-containing protein n=1 Tax=Potamilus streckersoni TaxID=2493646 RepID=A0AAE0SDS1_9BIVA|nr:hypothetical protein CHS0354_041046 [Potamilus streckersoni]
MARQVWFELPVSDLTDSESEESDDSQRTAPQQFIALKSPIPSLDLSKYECKTCLSSGLLSVRETNDCPGQHQEYCVYQSHASYWISHSIGNKELEALTKSQSEYLLKANMDQGNSSNQTVSSTNDSQDDMRKTFSSDEAWQSETTETSHEGNLGLSQYPLEDASQSSSIQDSAQDEAVHSAIMEVSTELVSGNYSLAKYAAGGSESSEISDEENANKGEGGCGIVARYPESSTGLSDSDWNPYSTESDNNMSPRQQPKREIKSYSDSEVKIRASESDDFEPGQRKPLRLEDAINTVAEVNGARLREQRAGLIPVSRLEHELSNDSSENKFSSSDNSRPSSKSPFSHDGRISRFENYPSTDAREFSSDNSGSDMDPVNLKSSKFYHEECVEDFKPEKLDILKYRIDNKWQKSSHIPISASSQVTDLPKEMEIKKDFAEQMNSDSKMACGDVGAGKKDTDRLERLQHAGKNIQELIESESLQRARTQSQSDGGRETKVLERRDSGEPIPRLKRSESPEPKLNKSATMAFQKEQDVTSTYVSVAEREKLMTDKTDGNAIKEKLVSSQSPAPRSPSDESLKRMAKMLEDTKKQVLEAVTPIMRPDPSGSEERFSLRERYSIPGQQRIGENILTTSQEKKDLFSILMKDDHTKLQKSQDLESLPSLTSLEVEKLFRKSDDCGQRYKLSQPLVSSYSSDERTVLTTTSAQSQSMASGKTQTSAFNAVDKAGDTQLTTDGKSVPALKEENDEHLRLRKDSESSESSEDSLHRQIQEVLAGTSHLERIKATSVTNRPSVPYTFQLRSLDYNRLQKDLEEIQVSLHTMDNGGGKPRRDDGGHLQCHEVDGRESLNHSREQDKSLGTISNPESAQDRKLLWDHAADFGYDENYSGQFIGNLTETDTESLSQRLKNIQKRLAVNSSGDDGLGCTGGTSATELDVQELEPDVDLDDLDKHGVQRPSGYPNEDVESIIARYRSDRQQLQDKFQPENDGRLTQEYKLLNQEPNMPQQKHSADERRENSPTEVSVRTRKKITESVEVPKPQTSPDEGLTARVNKILNSEPQLYKPVTHDNGKGLADEVKKILNEGHPEKQVHGILEEAMAHEREMIKKLLERPKMDSSNDSVSFDNSLTVPEENIRRQLEWSMLSSPCGPKHSGDHLGTDYSPIKPMGPFNAFSNAKTFLSSQLEKMSQQTFDKSIELHTPYRQAIKCYPLYGLEQVKDEGDNTSSQLPRGVREAWIQPGDRDSTAQGRDAGLPRGVNSTRDPLSNERFFLTERNGNPHRGVYNDDDLSPSRHQRALSDPFEIDPNRREQYHARSKSEEATMLPSDSLSQYSITSDQSITDRRPAFDSPPKYQRIPLSEKFTEHVARREASSKPADVPASQPFKTENGDSSLGVTSASESDNSANRSRELSRLRPYRPAGSRDIYYTESGDDTNDSGTTLESTHTGSDDAVGPYFPSQVLGSRKDEPPKHNIGIYDNNKKRDVLSTIDEKSVTDEKERALSESNGSGHGVENRPTSTSSQVSRNSGSSDRLSGRPKSVQSQDYIDSGVSSHDQHQQGSGSSSNQVEQTQGDRLLQDSIVNHVHTKDPDIRDPVRQSELRSHIGEKKILRSGFLHDDLNIRDLEERHDNFTHRDPVGRKSWDENRKDREGPKRLSDERYTSQMGASVRSDPGSQLVDLLDFPHDDLIKFQPLPIERDYPRERMLLSRSDTDLVALSPPESQKYSSPALPGARFMDFSSQPSPIFSNHDSVSSAKKDFRVGRSQDKALPMMAREDRIEREIPCADRQIEGPRVEQPRPLEKGEGLPVMRRERTRSPTIETERARIVSPESGSIPTTVQRRTAKSRGSPTNFQPLVPLHIREKELERELEDLSREDLFKLQEAHGTQEKPREVTDEEFEDNFPPSKKVQILREVLEEDVIEGIPPNINDMWHRFQELNQNPSDSSLNSSRMDALSNLLRNPTHHMVNRYLQEKNEEKEKQRQMTKKKFESQKEQRQQDMDKRILEEQMAQERVARREEMRQQHRLSEEESNGSYAEILMEKEKRKSKVTATKEQTAKRDHSHGKSKSSSHSPKKSKKEKENQKEDITHKREANQLDNMDTLFSIPEDTTLEESPDKVKESSHTKTKQHRQRHLIDPLMKKLKERIESQRTKISKEKGKEVRRLEKLKKLEMLLSAKTNGKLSDQAIDVELNYVSTTSTCQSESTESTELTLTAGSVMESDVLSQGSTTAKESSLESWKMNRDEELRETLWKLKEGEKNRMLVRYGQDDSESQSDKNYEKVNLKTKISEKKGSEKRSSSVEKKVKDLSKKKSSKKQKKIHIEELTKSPQIDKEKLARDILRQIHRERSRSPYARRRDVGTNFPSPVIGSHLSQRCFRVPKMVSEAIQTTPSVRSGSPTHAYEEVPVAPVPLMSPEVKRKVSALGRPTSRSPISRQRQNTCSPVARRTQSFSQDERHQSSSYSPNTKKKVELHPSSRLARQEAKFDTPPPKSQMFTPESPNENEDPARLGVPTGGSLAWFVPLKESKPWRKPLRERQAFAVLQEPWQPQSVSPSVWKDIIHGDVLKDRLTEDIGVIRDTKFYLDRHGHRIDEVLNDSEDEEEDVKALTKMTLQEAFLTYKQDTISRLRERQKRVNLAADERRIQDTLQKEREEIFAEQKRKVANPEAHPYSENLHKPSRRMFSKNEMKEHTGRIYKTLPEVVEKEKLKKRAEEYSLNRLRARIFNKKILRKVLKKP